jgi:hypothetical protein
MKKNIIIYGLILFASSILLSCNNSVSEKDLVGKTFDLDTYHRIEFKTSTRYWIYQRPLNCGGEGNWSLQNGKIVLGPNDSGCETTRGKMGTYEFSQLN